MKRRSSLRRTAAPIPVSLMASSLGTSVPAPNLFYGMICRLDASRDGQRAILLLGGLRHVAARHGPGARRDGLDDVVITGAAAQIAVELVTDGLLVELVSFAADNVERRHDHPGRAEPALQGVVLAERLLHRVELVARGQPLDGEDARTVERECEHGARLHGDAVHVHDTGPALGRVTTHMRS